MTAAAPLPPIGGYILTGQLTIRQAAHAPVILRHDLTTDFFGIAERAAGWPDYQTFHVYPISTAALAQLRAMLAEDDRHDIDTAHPAFGWLNRPKEPAPQLAGLPVTPPALFVTRAEQAAHAPPSPSPARPSLYQAFDFFLSAETWHLAHPDDERRFFAALNALLWREEFDPDAMAEYFTARLGLAYDDHESPFAVAVQHYRDKAWAIRDFVRFAGLVRP